MCKRRVPLRRSGLVITIAVLAIAAARVDAQRPGAQAPDALAALTAERAALADSVRASLARIREAERRAQTVADDSTTVHGVTVLYISAVLSERERATIAAGLGRARRLLAQRYGDAVAGVLDGDRWLVNWQVLPAGGRPAYLHITPGAEARRSQPAYFTLPLDAADIERLALQRVGLLVTAMHPALRGFAQGALSLAREVDHGYMARRQLVGSGSSPARRCVEGILPACAELLDFNARSRWYDPDDRRPPGISPMGGAVRASLIVHALELGGDAAVQRLREYSGPGDPLPMLSAVAGTAPDEFLEGWVATLDSQSATRLGLGGPLMTTSLAWTLLLALVATRRGLR